VLIGGPIGATSVLMRVDAHIPPTQGSYKISRRCRRVRSPNQPTKVETANTVLVGQRPLWGSEAHRPGTQRYSKRPTRLGMMRAATPPTLGQEPPRS
jgi:hypothetical protein